MKEIRETKMIEQTTVTFIADDGTAFDSKLYCERYEYEQKLEKDKHEVERLEHEFKIGSFNASYYDESREVHLYRVPNEDALFKIDVLFNKKFNLDENILDYKDRISLPSTVVVFDENRDYAHIPTRAEEYIKENGEKDYRWIPLTAKEVIDKFTERYEEFLSIANQM